MRWGKFGCTRSGREAILAEDWLALVFESVGTAVEDRGDPVLKGFGLIVLAALVVAALVVVATDKLLPVPRGMLSDEDKEPIDAPPPAATTDPVDSL